MSKISNAKLRKRREKAVPQGPFNVSPFFAKKAQGAHIWDVEEQKYLDFCGGIGVLNVGHNHPRVVSAIKAQVENLIHSCWHVMMYEPYLELAERLNELVPISGKTKTAFFNSGAEANENGVKIARAATGRSGIICVERAFHGRTLLAMTMTGKVKPYTTGFGPFAPDIYHLPYKPFYDPDHAASDEEVYKNAIKAMEALFHYQASPSSIAAMIFEPVLGEGGFFPIHPAALKAIKELARREGFLLIADEVQSGFARCGTLFASERYDLEPDLLLMAKSIAGGLPLSAISGKASIMDAPQVGGIGGTYGGNPLACAAGLAVLDIIQEENLCHKAEAIGKAVLQSFKELSEKYPFIGRYRGLGAMCALEIIDPASAEPNPEQTRRIIEAAHKKGLLIMPASGYILRTLMPLTISDDELREGLNILAEVMEKL